MGREIVVVVLAGGAARRADQAIDRPQVYEMGSKRQPDTVPTGSKAGIVVQPCGGGSIQLIVHTRACSYHDAKEWAREWLSLSREKRGAYTGVHPAAALLAGLADATGPDADDAKRIATAQRLWKASAPVAGTLGEHYLTAHRGIPCPSHGWPEAVRFHPDSRALIVAATLPDGTVQAV